MFGGVAALGLVAAADVAADEAEAQVEPTAAFGQTFFTTIGFRLDRLGQFEVSALFTGAGHKANHRDKNLLREQWAVSSKK
jgi:hypothetical protein